MAQLSLAQVLDESLSFGVLGDKGLGLCEMAKVSPSKVRHAAVRCPTQPQGGRARCPGGCHHGFPGVGRGWCGGLLRWTSLDRSCCFAAF